MPSPDTRPSLAWLLDHYAIRTRAHEAPELLLKPNPVVLEACDMCAGQAATPAGPCARCEGTGTDGRLGVLHDDRDLAAAVWPHAPHRLLCPRCNAEVDLRDRAKWRDQMHVSCGQLICVNA